MSQRAGSRPHVLIGDLNVYEQNGCSSGVDPYGLDAPADVVLLRLR